jgi:uncharacterized integral membrane protein
MKKVKLVIFGIVVVLLLVFAFQNQTYFMKTAQLELNLYFMDKMITPVISNAIVCLSFLVLGFVLSFLLSLPGRIKRKRIVKELNKTLSEREKELVTLKSETEKNQAPLAMKPPAEDTPPVAEEEPVAKTAA